MLGFGLLYYGQNYLIYPSAFPPGSRTGTFQLNHIICNTHSASDVPKPSDFGLNYEDLILSTPDGIRLYSYIMRQQRELDHYQAGHVDTIEGQTDEEVRVF